MGRKAGNQRPNPIRGRGTAPGATAQCGSATVTPVVSSVRVSPPPWPTRNAPFSDALVALGRARPDVVVLTADLANWTDVIGFAAEFPDRFFNLGMAEQNLVGVGAGMARSGVFPVIVTYGVFATRRAYDQVAMGLCTGGVRALLVGFLPGLSSQFKATHQAIDDVALMRALPGMTVLDPLDATELIGLTAAAANPGAGDTRGEGGGEGPIYLRASRGAVPVLLPDDAPIAIGATTTLRRGPDTVFFSTGMATRWALEAAQELATQGVEATVVHTATLKPFDPAPLVELADRFPMLHCVENHSVIGGLASAVSQAIVERGLPVRMISSGIPDRWGEYGRVEFNRMALGLDAVSIAARSLAALTTGYPTR
jgi:transketolase